MNVLIDYPIVGNAQSQDVRDLITYLRARGYNARIRQLGDMCFNALETDAPVELIKQWGKEVLEVAC